MKYLIYFTSIVILGCHKDVSLNGYYKDKNYNLEIRKDSTFVFEKIVSHSYSYNSGNWIKSTKNPKRIVLSSSPKVIKPLVIVKGYKISKEENFSEIKTKVILKNTTKELDNFGFWIFNEKKALTYGNCNSMPVIKNEDIKNLQYVFTYSSQNSTMGQGGQLTDILNIDKDHNYDITIELDYSLFFLEAFNDVGIRIKKNKIIINNFDKQKRIVIPKFYGDSINFLYHHDINGNKMNLDF